MFLKYPPNSATHFCGQHSQRRASSLIIRIFNRWIKKAGKECPPGYTITPHVPAFSPYRWFPSRLDTALSWSVNWSSQSKPPISSTKTIINQSQITCPRRCYFQINVNPNRSLNHPPAPVNRRARLFTQLLGKHFLQALDPLQKCLLQFLIGNTVPIRFANSNGHNISFSKSHKNKYYT